MTLSSLISLAAAVLASGTLSADVEVISPKPGTELSGNVEVVARVTPPTGQTISAVIVESETGDMARLALGASGTYSAVIDTTRMPNGRQSLMVIESIKGLTPQRSGAQEGWSTALRLYDAEVPVVVRNPYRFFWGDLHAHTSYSDGVRTPSDAYRYARDKSKLDFFAVTDHSNLLSFDKYADVIAQAKRFDNPGKFVALYGAESTEGTGHMNFYLAPTPRIPSARDEIYQYLGRMRVLAQFNHPDLNSPPDQGWKDDYEGFHYSPAADPYVALVEVRSAKEEAAYIALLNAGWHVGAAANDDTHQADWGSANWTVALARDLTRSGIIEAIASRRTYSTPDRDLKILFTLDGEDMGAQVARRAGTYSVSTMVEDTDPRDAIDSIDLFVDGAIAGTATPQLTRYTWAVPISLAAGKHYVFVRVTQPGGKQSWSSPIWVSAY
jgi:hypothetical protein